MKPVQKPPALSTPEPTSNQLLLHPILRSALHEVTLELTSGLIPIRVFETFRAPQRQAYLYQLGRTSPGKIVTNALPWSSLHQYGLAVDFALYLDGQFVWPTGSLYEPHWERLQEIGDFYGLEPKSGPNEQCHLQMSGQDISELQAGVFPSGGDPDWWHNLESHIQAWTGQPPAPDLSQKLPSHTPNPYQGMPRFPVTD